jgi:hypothetical protein
MHLIIAFASVLSEAGRQALQTLALPNLAALVGRLAPQPPDAGDEYSLTPPHERERARALGLEGPDGALPWAAHDAAAQGIDTGDLAWGLVTPVHWHVGASEISLADPAALGLTDDESRALLEAVHPLFESEGHVLVYGGPLAWYAAHESFAGLRTASLDRVIGRRIDPWLDSLAHARTVRRLQNEVQMLLHEHPVNEAREARGLPAVNSFWLSGCGAHQPVRVGAELQFDTRLRAPALDEDWAAWVGAWQALDRGPLAGALQRVRQGERCCVSLCGERHAQRFESRPAPWLARLAQRWQAPALPPLLEAL